MRLFQAPLDTCLGSPFFASLSVHGLHFMVYAASIKTKVDVSKMDVKGFPNYFFGGGGGGPGTGTRISLPSQRCVRSRLVCLMFVGLLRIRLFGAAIGTEGDATKQTSEKKIANEGFGKEVHRNR